MKFIETGFKGLLICEPEVFGDDRGFFEETYHRQIFFDHGLHYDFKQDNHSFSGAGILRGMHFQIRHKQAKLVRVVTGEVLDAVVDLRKAASTYGQSFSTTLNSVNKRMLLVPAGFAHGFQTTVPTNFVYKVNNYRDQSAERGINPLDSALGIDWPVNNPQLNARDASWPTFNEVAGIKIRQVK